MSGFSHKAPVLVSKISQRLASLTFTDELFEVWCTKTKQDYTNYFLHQPYQHAMAARIYGTTSPRWHMLDKLAAIEGLTADDLRSFMPTLTKDLFTGTLNTQRLKVHAIGAYEMSLPPCRLCIRSQM